MGSGGDKEMGSEGDDMRLLRTQSILDRLMALPKWLRTGWRVSPTPHLLVSLSLFLLHASTAHAGAMLLHIGTTTPRVDVSRGGHCATHCVHLFDEMALANPAN